MSLGSISIGDFAGPSKQQMYTICKVLSKIPSVVA